MKFLQEEPSKSDEFHGAHEQVANALSEIIMLRNNVPGMIALEGGLGSGKSTVLRILESKIKQSDFEIFVFDCFKYQNGPIRRAFFEQFHLFLKDHVCFTKHSKLAELELRATGRLDETEGADEFKINWWTLLFAVLLPLSAAALLLVGRNSSNIPSALLYILAAAPLLQILLGRIIWKRMLPDTSLKSGKRISRTVLLSTTEVTSADLAKYYGQFLACLPAKKNIVLVLDNIDRLDAEKLFDVWADMEIFSRKASGEPHWVIVPYALDQLRRAFRERYKYPSGHNTAHGNREDEGVKDIDASADMTEEFINKWFALRYRVPEVLLSDWKAYFRDKWRTVFPACDEQTYEQVMLLFRRYRAQARDVTPRNIKHFINDVGVKWSSNIDQSVDLRLVVAYQLLIQDYSGNLIGLFSNELGDTDYAVNLIAKVDSDWQKTMAGLHYNVTSDRAQQIILDEPLLNALDTVNSEEFARLIALDGGLDCLEDSLEAGDNFEQLKNAFICASSLESLGDRLVRLLERKVSVTNAVPFGDSEDFALSIPKVLGKAAGKVQLQRFYDLFKAAINDADSESFEPLLKVIDLLNPYVEQSVLEPEAENLVSLWLPHRGNYPNLTHSSFVSNSLEGEQRFSAMIQMWENVGDENEVPWSSLDIAELAFSFPEAAHLTKPSPFEGFMGDGSDWFERIEPDSPSAVQSLFLIVILFDKEVDYSTVFTRLLLEDQISSFDEKLKPLLLCGLLALAIKFKVVADHVKYFNDLEINEHLALMRKLLWTCCSYQHMVLAFSSADDNGGTCAALLADSISKNWYSSNTHTLMHSYESYKDLVKRELLAPQDLWSWIERNENSLISKIKESEWHSLPRQLLVDIVSEKPSIHEFTCEYLSEAFLDESRGKDEWVEIIENQNFPITLSVEVVEAGKSPLNSMVEAIAEVIERHLESNAEIDCKEFLFSCIAKLPSTSVLSLTNKLRKVILNHASTGNSQIVDGFIAGYGDKDDLLIPMVADEAHGFLDLLSMVVAAPGQHPAITDYLVKHAADIYRKIRPVGFIKVEQVRDVLDQAPLYTSSETIGKMESICRSFNHKLSRPNSETNGDE